MGIPVLHVEGYQPVEIDGQRTLLELCEDHGIPMECACGGFAACNSCRVLVLQGADNLTAKLPEEDAFLDAPAQRLGCQATPLGHAVVRLDPGI